MARVNEDKLYRLLSEMLSAIEENPSIAETELRNTYIIKLIHNLGWADNNIESEKGIKLATTNHRVDYDLTYKGKSKVAIEIKRPKEPLDKGAEDQLADYLYKLKSDIGLAFNGHDLTILNSNGKRLDKWTFDNNESIPKNVSTLIEILKKYLAYDVVTKNNFDKDINERGERIVKNKIKSEADNNEVSGIIAVNNVTKTQTNSHVLIGVVIIGLILLIFIFFILSDYNVPPQYTSPSTVPIYTSTIYHHLLFNFSNNTFGGRFCLVPNVPYVYKEYHLTKGENITWVINQTVSLSTEIILINKSNFDSFIKMVQNASSQYINFKNECNFYYSNSNNSTASFCKNYSDQNYYATIEPYRILEPEIQTLNPVMEALPTYYINNINFSTPITGNYFFIILASRLSGIS
ncbi:MAG: type I restriction enzyme HsdR N-terminal domain-containing protein, partial [Conexivisphaerales archaeon]